MHNTLTQKKLFVPSEYRSTDWVVLQLKTYFATTELAATINVCSTTPFWNGIALTARTNTF